FFSRRHGYATTFCDLKNHRVYDVVLGRSAASLEAYFQALEGKSSVRVVCIDLAPNYRALVRKHFPNADRGRPLSRDPAGEPPLSQLLARSGRRGLKEPWTAFADAPTPPQSQTRPVRETHSLFPLSAR